MSRVRRYNPTGETRPCDQCGALIFRTSQWSAAQWEARRYCSQKCTGQALATKLLRERQEQFDALKEQFEARFTKSDGCWEWQGTIGSYGYGVLWNAGKHYRAHVLALVFDGRPVPKGMCGCHHCDNPKCVRPDHLYVGTAKQNAEDASNRFRLRIGSDHWKAKLSEDLIKTIRKMEGTQTDIAKTFGVSRPTIARVKNGETGRHIR